LADGRESLNLFRGFSPEYAAQDKSGEKAVGIRQNFVCVGRRWKE
jgi:hypothetical protein